MPNRIKIDDREGRVLVTSDLHGNMDDWLELEKIFRDGLARGTLSRWIALGDFVHGPKPGKRTEWAGEDLYAYPDRSRELVEAVERISREMPDRFVTLIGNHEHAHVGGRRTGRYHPDEAAHLESQMEPAAVERMHALFRSWPLVVQLPACGVVFTHGAPPDDCCWGPAVIDDACLEGGCPRDSAEFLEGVLWNYGFGPDGGRKFLDALSVDGERYDLIVHGHDRDLEGGSANSEHAFVLCTSFGAKRARKAYLTLSLDRRYSGPQDLTEGREIHRLYG
jgi:hypothetical protein